MHPTSTPQHEISHFLAFRKPLYNKLLALFGNLPLVVPVAVKFREYHHDHHIFLVRPPASRTTSARALVRCAALAAHTRGQARHARASACCVVTPSIPEAPGLECLPPLLQGVDGGDVDLPTVLESSWITGFFSKLFFTFIYLAIYAIRPLVVRPKAASERPPLPSRCRGLVPRQPALAAPWEGGAASSCALRRHALTSATLHSPSPCSPCRRGQLGGGDRRRPGGALLLGPQVAGLPAGRLAAGRRAAPHGRPPDCRALHVCQRPGDVQVRAGLQQPAAWLTLARAAGGARF